MIDGDKTPAYNMTKLPPLAQAQTTTSCSHTIAIASLKKQKIIRKTLYY